MNAIDIAFKLHDGISFYWNFYVPSCVAILGWVFSRKDPWPLVKRVAVCFLFIGFTVTTMAPLKQKSIQRPAGPARRMAPVALQFQQNPL